MNQRWLRWATIIATGALLLVVARWMSLALHRHPWNGYLLPGILLWALVILERLSLKLETLPTDNSSSESAVLITEYLEALLKSVLELRRTADHELIAPYIPQCLAPQKFRRRVSYNLTLGREETLRQVWVDVAQAIIPTGGRTETLIPLISAPKGKLYDGLHLEHPDVADASMLDYRSGLTVTAAAFTLLMENAYGLSGVVEDWDTDYQNLLLRGFELMTLSAPRPGHTDRIEKLMELYRTEALKLRVSDAEEFERLLTFLAGQIDTYRIIARVPARPLMRISYTYRTRTRDLMMGDDDVHSLIGLTRRMKRRFRPMSGAVGLPLSRATHAASFHIEVAIPPGSYIDGTDLINERNQVLAPMQPSLHNAHRWYFRRPRVGSSVLHFYSRNFDQLGIIPSLKVRVYERPWGTLSVGFLSSILVLPIVYLFGAASRLSSHDPNHLPIDVVSAGLALPSFVLALMTSLIYVARRALSPSLLGRLFSGLSILLLMTAIAGYIFELFLISARPATAHSFSNFWKTLEISSGLAAFCALTVTAIRIARYQQARLRRT